MKSWAISTILNSGGLPASNQRVASGALDRLPVQDPCYAIDGFGGISFSMSFVFHSGERAVTRPRQFLPRGKNLERSRKRRYQ